MNGTIKRLIKDKGYGFIAVKGGNEFFFHKTALINVKFEDLVEGQAVAFEPGEGTKGPRAEDITV